MFFWSGAGVLVGVLVVTGAWAGQISLRCPSRAGGWRDGKLDAIFAGLVDLILLCGVHGMEEEEEKEKEEEGEKKEGEKK